MSQRRGQYFKCISFRLQDHLRRTCWRLARLDVWSCHVPVLGPPYLGINGARAPQLAHEFWKCDGFRLNPHEPASVMRILTAIGWKLTSHASMPASTTFKAPSWLVLSTEPKEMSELSREPTLAIQWGSPPSKGLWPGWLEISQLGASGWEWKVRSCDARCHLAMEGNSIRQPTFAKRCFFSAT